MAGYIGELPGFHWGKTTFLHPFTIRIQTLTHAPDESSQKYFKTQANHNAANASGKKHTFQSVQREKHREKKRKIRADAETKQRQQTVKRSNFSSSSTLYGAGLARELGQSARRNAEARDAAHVNQLAITRTPFESAYDDIYTTTDKILNVQYLPALKRRLLAFHLVDPSGSLSQVVTQRDSETVGLKPPESQKEIAAFDGSLTGLSITHTPGYATNVLACSFTRGGGNMSFSVMFDDDENINTINLALKPRTHSEPPPSLWTCALSPNTRYGAIGTDEGVYLLDMQTTRVCNHLSSWSNYMALEWLGPNLLIAGQSYRHRDDGELAITRINGPPGSVFLYDTRVRQASLRFRDTQAITGIRSANNSQQQMIVSTNKTISLFDLRKTSSKTPLLSFEHHASRPELPLAVDPAGGLIAAPDSHNQVQVYSLRSGTHLKALPMLPDNTDNITQVDFSEDAVGRPILDVCQGRDFAHFTWEDDVG